MLQNTHAQFHFIGQITHWIASLIVFILNWYADAEPKYTLCLDKASNPFELPKKAHQCFFIEIVFFRTCVPKHKLRSYRNYTFVGSTTTYGRVTSNLWPRICGIWRISTQLPIIRRNLKNIGHVAFVKQSSRRFYLSAQRTQQVCIGITLMRIIYRYDEHKENYELRKLNQQPKSTSTSIIGPLIKMLYVPFFVCMFWRFIDTLMNISFPIIFR